MAIGKDKIGVSFRLTIKEDEDLTKVLKGLPYGKSEYIRLAITENPNYKGIDYVYGVPMIAQSSSITRIKDKELNELVKKAKLRNFSGKGKSEYIRYVVVNKVKLDIKNLKEV